MGITSAMYSGVSGLNTNSQAMSVIGNNLANTNTVGFKGARTLFSDLLSSNVSGSGGVSQVGRGVNVSIVDNVFSQGTFESTTSVTDVAIEGEGFFLVKASDDDTVYYTRAGSFRFDENGYLVNPEGYRVQGKQYDPIENDTLIPGDPSDIMVNNEGLSEAQASATVTFNTNLDASSGLIAAAWDPDDPATYSYSASVEVFDSLGAGHTVSVYWTHTAANTWAWRWTAQNDAVPPVDVGQLAGAAAAGTITFNPDGSLLAGGTGAINVANWANGSDAQPLALTFDCTQYSSDSIVISQEQDGWAAGSLTQVAIDDEGNVVATYSNGQKTNIAQLSLAKFKNPNGLSLAGSNLYEATTDSGEPRIGGPGAELGTIYTSSLEQSNVDMGQEFVKMITVQRGFQANSKIISTVDELLGELINLKR
ncbi:MAG: flagellar basal-body rod protein FlgF [Desulfobulbaceae bacterium A2]|nr:MAG: flagellar basal-body rod protein FlgF [Desulfobulbaceae bacterium A2]